MRLYRRGLGEANYYKCLYSKCLRPMDDLIFVASNMNRSFSIYAGTRGLSRLSVWFYEARVDSLFSGLYAALGTEVTYPDSVGWKAAFLMDCAR